VTLLIDVNNRLTIPITIERVVADLDVFGGSINAGGWATAACVWAWTDVGKPGPGQKESSDEKSSELSITDFAGLGIRGLKTRDSVRKYRNAWQRAISHGSAVDVHPGDAVELPTDLFTGSGMFSSDSPEWYTPRHVLDLVVRVLGAIDLDPCSNGHETPAVSAAQHFTQDDDGLSQEWHGRVFMNPPYGPVIKDWVQKLVDEFASGRTTEAIALMPARTDTTWFGLLRDHPRSFITGRLKFSESEASAPFPSAVFYLGPNPARFTEVFAALGDVYLLASPA
jgi:phage N-6-adenine-methyltransferase